MTFTLGDLRLLLLTLVGIALVLAFLRWYEPRMIYYPHVPGRAVRRTPADAGLAYEPVTLTASDGVRITGWHLPAEASDAPTLLFFHGNAGNIGDRVEKCRVFHDLGVNVLVIDYRGYGTSEGCPSESGMYRDADAAYAYLTQTRGVPPARVLLYGESLGTGVAVDLAARVPVGGVILEAPFTSVADAGQQIFWFLPGAIRWIIRNRYDSRRKIGRIRAPLLLLHADGDALFTYRRHAAPLYAVAPEPKRLVTLRGGHNDAFFHDAPTACAALLDFVRTSRG